MSERRSERHIGQADVDDAAVRRVLRAAATAPSAGNRQQYRFMVVRRRETLGRMVEAVEQAVARELSRHASRLGGDVRDYASNFVHFGGAPVVVCVLYRGAGAGGAGVAGASPSEHGRELDPMIGVRETLSSAAAATMQLLLAAHALGLAACWMTGPCLAESELLELLRAPHGWRLAALVPIGRSDVPPPRPKRRSLEQLMIPEPVLLESGLGEAGLGETGVRDPERRARERR